MKHAMTVQFAAALLVVYGLVTAEAALWSKQAPEPAFAIVPPRLASEGQGEATDCQ